MRLSVASIGAIGGVLLGVLPALSSAATPESVVEPMASEVSNATVRVAVLPTYPRRALKRKLDGEVTLEFTISRFGRASDTRIVAETPRRVFRHVAMDALKYWLFNPARPVACGTIEQQARQTFRFRHAHDKQVQILPIVIDGQATLPRAERAITPKLARIEGEAARAATQMTARGLTPIYRVDPVYPEKALERRKEGIVAISFLIEKNGSVSTPQVVDAVQGGIFSAAALRALDRWQFEPYLRDGVPTERVACHEFIFVVDEYLYKNRERSKIEQNILTLP